MDYLFIKCGRLVKFGIIKYSSRVEYFNECRVLDFKFIGYVFMLICWIMVENYLLYYVVV